VTIEAPQLKGTDDAAWRRFVVRFVAVFIAVLAATLAFVMLIDPYDSGRFPSIGISGVSDVSQRTLNVSLGRSEKFDAAIFGNSHGQLLDPERLSQSTGLSFVQLTIPGAFAPEQLAMMHFFIRHHPRIGALVLVVDRLWCSEHPEPWNWFPFWLYGDSDLVYLVHSLNARSAGAAFRRIRHAMGQLAPSFPRGYDDYEKGRPADYRFDFPKRIPSVGRLTTVVDLSARAFPAIDRLAAELAAAPAGTPLVVVFPPVYYATLPNVPQRIAEVRECKARLERLAARTPHGGLLDYFVDSPLTRDQASFQDLEHHRAPVARRIEQTITDMLKGASAASR
jgi:hypothetical protein